MRPRESLFFRNMSKAILDFEAEALWEAASQVPEGGSIVEIGSYKGSSTYAMALSCMDRNVKIYAVDTWMGSPGGIEEWGPKRGVLSAGSYFPEFKANLKEMIDADIVIPLEMSSAGALMYEPRLEPHFIFIDGSHVYEDVLFDLTYWWERLQPNGILALHDSSSDLRWHPQVKRALDRFMEMRQLELFGPLIGSISWLRKQ